MKHKTKPKPMDIAIMNIVEKYNLPNKITANEMFDILQPKFFPDYDETLQPYMRSVVKADVYRRVYKIRNHGWMPIYAFKRNGYAVMTGDDYRKIRPGYHKFTVATARTLRTILYNELKACADLRQQMKIKEHIAIVEALLEAHKQEVIVEVA